MAACTALANITFLRLSVALAHIIRFSKRPHTAPQCVQVFESIDIIFGRKRFSCIFDENAWWLAYCPAYRCIHDVGFRPVGIPIQCCEHFGDIDAQVSNSTDESHETRAQSCCAGGFMRALGILQLGFIAEGPV